MPPKRLRANTSCVSFSPIQHSFISPAAANYFKDFMTKDKAIICKVQFQPDRNDGDILAMLQWRGWESIAVLGGDVNVNAVREFYANLKAANIAGPVKVRNKFINFSAEAINTHLGLDNDTPNDFQTMMDAGPDYELILQEMGHRGSTWIYSTQDQARPIHIISSCLNKYAQAWCKFLRGNLMPTSQKSQLTKEQVVLLYCILTGRSINVGQIIHSNILACGKGSTTSGHIHPVLITHLCASANVPMSNNDEPWLQQALYGSSNISNIANWPYGTARANGLGFVEHDANAVIPPQPMLMPRVRRYPQPSFFTFVHPELAHERDVRREARTKQRYESQSSVPPNHGASSSSMPPHSYTTVDVGRMVAQLAVQQEQLSTRQARMEQRLMEHSQFTAQYIAAFNAHQGYSTQSTPPFPTYPEHLLRPFDFPRDDANDDTPGLA